MALIDINWRPAANELRVFGGLQLIFFALVAWALHARLDSPAPALAVLGLSAAAAVIGLLRPDWLRPMYVVWMAAALPIGWVVSHLLLAAVFYLVVTPIGLTMRLCGRDPLQRKFDRAASTYWVRRPAVDDTERCFRQF